MKATTPIRPISAAIASSLTRLNVLNARCRRASARRKKHWQNRHHHQTFYWPSVGSPGHPVRMDPHVTRLLVSEQRRLQK